MDRRDFLKLAVAGAAVVGTRSVASRANADAKPAGSKLGKKIEVGVIGGGSASRHYLWDLAFSPFVELVG